jgi:hypothetical protein
MVLLTDTEENEKRNKKWKSLVFNLFYIVLSLLCVWLLVNVVIIKPGLQHPFTTEPLYSRYLLRNKKEPAKIEEEDDNVVIPTTS